MRALLKTTATAFRRRTPVVLASVAALLLLGAGPAQNPKLEIVIGTVVIGTGEPPVWRPAAEGDVLQPGDVVRTGADGRAELRMAAGIVRLYEDSTLRLPDAFSAGTDGVDLEEGASIFDILKRRSGRNFEVRTPEAVVMVKGTRFSVSVDAAGAAVSVFRGLVGVRGLAKGATREVLVHEGFTATGARSVPFTLDLIRTRTDTWEGWSKQQPRPITETKAQRGPQPGPRPEIEFAKDATSMSMARRMARYMKMDREAIAHHTDAGMMGTTYPDPIADSHNSELYNEVQEQYAATTLGGTTNFSVELINSGVSDYIQITGGSLNESLYQSELQKVIGGDQSVLSPTLLNILNNQGIQPEYFAENLLNMF